MNFLLSKKTTRKMYKRHGNYIFNVNCVAQIILESFYSVSVWVKKSPKLRDSAGFSYFFSLFVPTENIFHSVILYTNVGGTRAILQSYGVSLEEKKRK